jgi:hypothetical protein
MIGGHPGDHQRSHPGRALSAAQDAGKPGHLEQDEV